MTNPVIIGDATLYCGDCHEIMRCYDGMAPNPMRFGIDTVLFLEDARRKRLRRVVIAHRHHRLAHDGSGVHAFVNQMHRTPGEFHAVFQRLPLRVLARKRRKQGRMNI